jgi:hypothetical protein
MSQSDKNEQTDPPKPLTRMVRPANQEGKEHFGARLPKPPLQMQRRSNQIRLEGGQYVPKQPPAPPSNNKKSKNQRKK